jgi:bifunctional enzyme CysN/CysC
VTVSRQEQVSGQAPINIVTIGHVDHGKSTLVGRLVHDAGGLPPGRVEEIRAMSERRGMPFEWAFVTDASQAERDQGITIDVAEMRLRRPAHEYVFIDAPGHREFIRNMLTGAARADGALLLIDAAEGVQEQTRLHGLIAQLIGLRSVIVVVNKLDLIDYDRRRFNEISGIVTPYLKALGIEPLAVIPVSARGGDNVVNRSQRIKWYAGPTVMEAISSISPAHADSEGPLRIALQDIYKFDERRIFAGRILSGKLRAGDTVLFSPSHKMAQVRTIETWPEKPVSDSAIAGQSVGFTVEDQLFVERGQVVSLTQDAPLTANTIRLRIFWMAADTLHGGETIVVKHGTHTTPASVREIHDVVDTQTLSQDHTAKAIGRFNVAEITVRTQALLAVDIFDRLPRSGRLILLREGNVVGCGLVLEAQPLGVHRGAEPANLIAVGHAIEATTRAVRNTHRGGVVWLTGLSGAGKSTIAMGVEKELFRLGYQVYVLDGDNVRRGLNRDLGFSAEDRVENIRRVGEMAALFADAGLIAVTSFISPYQSDRDLARDVAGDDFREVYIRADLATCERRDPKGLYKKARAGAIRDFTGVSAPYEEPITPDLVIDTTIADQQSSIRAVVEFIRREFKLTD